MDDIYENIFLQGHLFVLTVLGSVILFRLAFFMSFVWFVFFRIVVGVSFRRH